MEEGGVIGLLALAAGIALGVNWPKIKRNLPKLREQAENLTESAKEAVSEAAEAVTDAAKGVLGQKRRAARKAR